ncbi:TonB-dependent receptor [Bacteroides sp. 51]|uniref:SusC/RagA family TonB-linked outer membrane protein n=1 Tax=Bacteroides sp. 51 TaxID=2302938 RepID=UPI0013D7BA97|nr:TonB-dependent receptor [Bacteroides sp. 51]
MKISLFLLFTCAFQLMAITSEAQNAMISIKTNPLTVGQLISEIEKQTDYLVVYSTQEVDINRNIHVRKTSDKVATYLDEAFNETPIGYEFRKDYILLTTSKNLLSADNRQQVPQITGVVVDEKGEPVIGANVSVIGENVGSITDLNGYFALQSQQGKTLQVSFIGYVTQKVTVKGTQLQIVLIEDNKTLDEVVVVGYGTQKKVNLTGAVGIVASHDLTIKPVGQTSAALQGVVPGMTITQRSGEPGNDSGSIRIRGIGTLSDANPLVLIDGIEGSINNVDPNTIESISVLKDAASASIYGSRAANGVLLVTTKRGKEGKFSISYSNYLGWQEPTNLPDLVDAIDYMELLNTAYSNVGRQPLYSDELIGEYRKQNGVSSDLYPNTDWQKLTLTKSGFQQNHFLNVSGGTDRLKMFTSIGYFSQDGLIENSSFDRLNIRNNMDWQLTSKLKAKVDLQFTNTKRINPSSGAANIFQWMNSIPANQIAVNSDGSWGVGWSGINPVARAKEGGESVGKTTWGSANASLIYSPFSWLTGEVNVAPKYTVTGSHNLTKAIQTYLPDGTPSYMSPVKSELTDSSRKTLNNNVRATVTAEKEFGKHDFKALLGASQEEYKSDVFSAYRDSIDVNYPVLNTGSAKNQTVSGNAEKWVLRSFFARVNYNYKQKYLFEFNVRHDGSSRFAKGNKWATFPSMSAGWRISEESFMKPLKESFLDDLKIRVSWGKLGNQSIGTTYYPFTTQMGFGVTAMDGNVVNTSRFGTMPNSEIKWETTETTDVGLDFTLFGKLNVTADYYYKKTSDILLSLPIPHTIGLNPPIQNAGVVENKGWELSIGYRDRIGDFAYNVNFNLSDVKNKILDYKGQDETGFIANREGYPIGSLYGYIAEGYFQSDDEVANAPKQFGTVKAGDIKYKNMNDDDKIDSSDKVVIGSTIPRYTFGMNLGGSYKGFDCSMFFQGVGKADGYLDGAGIIPFVNGGGVGGTVLESFKDYWTEDNRSAAYPRLTFNETNNSQNSTFWLKDASYLRLKNLQIGYTLPAVITKKAGISKLRIFANGTNLFTLDKFWDGYNVESPIGSVVFYPQVKVYSFGVEVNF